MTKTFVMQSIFTVYLRVHSIDAEGQKFLAGSGIKPQVSLPFHEICYLLHYPSQVQKPAYNPSLTWTYGLVFVYYALCNAP